MNLHCKLTLLKSSVKVEKSCVAKEVLLVLFFIELNHFCRKICIASAKAQGDWSFDDNNSLDRDLSIWFVAERNSPIATLTQLGDTHGSSRLALISLFDVKSDEAISFKTGCEGPLL